MNMNTNKVIIVVMAAFLIIMAVIIGFVAVDNRTEQTHPVGPMIGDEQIQPYDTAPPMIPRDSDVIVYIPAYPGDECAPEDRVLIDTPIRVVDADGTVYWHWFYESKDHAWNMTIPAELWGEQKT